jgi:hypothetical protein
MKEAVTRLKIPVNIAIGMQMIQAGCDVLKERNDLIKGHVSRSVDAFWVL